MFLVDTPRVLVLPFPNGSKEIKDEYDVYKL